VVEAVPGLSKAETATLLRFVVGIPNKIGSECCQFESLTVELFRASTGGAFGVYFGNIGRRGGSVEGWSRPKRYDYFDSGRTSFAFSLVGTGEKFKAIRDEIAESYECIGGPGSYTSTRTIAGVASWDEDVEGGTQGTKWGPTDKAESWAFDLQDAAGENRLWKALGGGGKKKLIKCEFLGQFRLADACN
jgi:hypothetical protein